MSDVTKVEQQAQTVVNEAGKAAAPVANEVAQQVANFTSGGMFIAQAAHFLFGVVACLSLLAYVPTHFGWAVLASVLFWAYGVGKEAWFDPKYEKAPFFWNGFVDLAFLLGGNTVAWVIYVIHAHS